MKLSVPIFKLKRQAKLLAREKNIPLHSALNRTANEQGFKQWSHMVKYVADKNSTPEILHKLNDGELLLLAARPGHGKTSLALQLLLTAIKSGKQGYFFTLDYTDTNVFSKINELGYNPDHFSKRLFVDTSDEICAEYIAIHIQQATRKPFVVIDYMQLLDQNRKNPALEAQIKQLAEVAEKEGAIIVMLSQIDRSYEMVDKKVPDLEDIKLPNAVDLNHFSKTCFLHDGRMEFSEVI